MPEKKYLNAIIVDDEEKAIQNLRKLIDTYCPSISVAHVAVGVDSAAMLINHHKPDVVFLDISMPKKSGFDLLHLLTYMPLVVFVTAYEKYALNAIKASAVDFLLKPVDVNELKKVEEKLLLIHSFRETGQSRNYDMVVSNLVHMLQQPGTLTNITLADSSGYNIVPVDDILYLEGEDNYTYFHLNKHPKIVVSKTLKDYEDLLHEAAFFRIHKSSIINLKHLKKVTTDDSICAVMSDGHKLPVSRRRFAEFVENAKHYIKI